MAEKEERINDETADTPVLGCWTIGGSITGESLEVFCVGRKSSKASHGASRGLHSPSAPSVLWRSFILTVRQNFYAQLSFQEANNKETLSALYCPTCLQK